MTVPDRSLSLLVDDIDVIRLTNVAWIRQAEQHNRASPNLPGARERTPQLEATLFWLRQLADLSAAGGGDDARVAVWLSRRLAQMREGSA